VRFLAVLELFKKGLVDLDQAHTFGDIGVVWLGEDGARELGEVGSLEDVIAVDAYDG
jgi:chromatin segregation and condensation protein Rec8/ScpA/Scc1 (kleisin family)